MLLCIAANAIGFEIIGPAAIQTRNQITHVMALVIDCAQRRPSVFSGEELKRLWRIAHTLVRINIGTRRMGRNQQLQTIDKQRFFQFIRHPQFILSSLLFQLVPTNAHVLNRVGLVVVAWLFQVPHLASTHEVTNELKSIAIPCIQVRTRRRLAIELGDIERNETCCCGAGPRRSGKFCFSLHNPRRPKHAHGIGFVALAETKDQVSRRRRGRCRISLELLIETARAHFNLRFHSAAVTDVPVEIDLD